MSIRIQQKSDDYKHQLSNLTNEFSNREEELKKQIEAFQVIYTVCTQDIQPCIEPHIWDSQRLYVLISVCRIRNEQGSWETSCNFVEDFC